MTRRNPADVGKKIDTLRIRASVKEHLVSLYFNRRDAKFNACFEEKWFSSKDVHELEREVTKAAKAAEQLTYSWVIQYSMSVTVGERNLRSGSSTTVGCDEDSTLEEALEKNHYHRGDTILGMEFSFSVLEISEKIAGSEMQRCRAVEENEDGVLVPVGVYENSHSHWQNDRSLPYTPQRYAKFKHLREQLATLYKSVREVLRGDTEKVAALFDSLDLPELLTSPVALPALPAPRKKKR